MARAKASVARQIPDKVVVSTVVVGLIVVVVVGVEDLYNKLKLRSSHQPTSGILTEISYAIFSWPYLLPLIFQKRHNRQSSP